MDKSISRPSSAEQPELPTGFITPDVLRRAVQKLRDGSVSYIESVDIEQCYGPLRTITAQRGASDA